MTRNDRCKPTCRDDHHDLGDRMWREGTTCARCGATPVPHYGFTIPCRQSANGSHKLEVAND